MAWVSDNVINVDDDEYYFPVRLLLAFMIDIFSIFAA
jgi:hypothetical protein